MKKIGLFLLFLFAAIVGFPNLAKAYELFRFYGWESGADFTIGVNGYDDGFSYYGGEEEIVYLNINGTDISLPLNLIDNFVEVIIFRDAFANLTPGQSVKHLIFSSPWEASFNFIFYNSADNLLLSWGRRGVNDMCDWDVDDCIPQNYSPDLLHPVRQYDNDRYDATYLGSVTQESNLIASSGIAEPINLTTAENSAEDALSLFDFTITDRGVMGYQQKLAMLWLMFRERHQIPFAIKSHGV